jgi:ESS family glutamate:Na+ symporter
MKYNLPSPVIAGFLVATVLALLKTNNIFEISFDKAAEQGLMIAFFASIGYSASFRLLKEGGRAVIFFLVLSVIGLILQIGAGVGAALAMDLPPLI